MPLCSCVQVKVCGREGQRGKWTGDNNYYHRRGTALKLCVTPAVPLLSTLTSTLALALCVCVFVLLVQALMSPLSADI